MRRSGRDSKFHPFHHLHLEIDEEIEIVTEITFGGRFQIVVLPIRVQELTRRNILISNFYKYVIFVLCIEIPCKSPCYKQNGYHKFFHSVFFFGQF